MLTLAGTAWANPEGPPEGEAPAGHEEQASHGEHEEAGIPLSTLAMQTINLLLFLGLLFWFARRPVGDALHNRANEVRRQLDEAARLRDEAAAKYAEIEARMAGLDKRIEEMKERATQEAAAEGRRMAERAEADAARIQETAERTIREEAVRARNEIRKEAANAAVGLAREQLRAGVNDGDQDRLARELMRTMDNGGSHD